MLGKCEHLQHTPAMQHEWLSCWVIEDHPLKLKEHAALQWLGEVISNHVLSWTVLEKKITTGDVVGDEQLAHVEVSGVLGT